MEYQKFGKVLGLSLLGCALSWSPNPQAQKRKLADWLTDGGNVERTAWQQDETILTTANVKNMKLLWKTRLDNPPRQMHNLLPVLIIGRVDTSSGPRQMVIVTGVSDNIYGLDAETGEIIWKHHFETSWVPPEGGGRGAGILCPGGITATPVVGPTDTLGKYIIYAAAWDGTLRRLNAADGKEVAPPANFMPPNGKPYALSLFNNVIYTHTAQGCGGNPNMVYTYDLATDKVGSWGPAGGGMWGRTGPAISSTGVLYTGTGDGPWNPENGVFGNGIIGVKQNPQTKAVELVDYYGPSNAEWLWKRDLDMQVTPAIFKYKGKELMVDAGKECVVYLLDTESIGGDDHRTPLHRTPLICNEEVNFASAGIWGSMASWEDSKGARWALTPFWGPKHSKWKAPIENGPVKYGAIAAFKVEEKAGKWTLAPAWLSRDMNRAEPPVIANGVIFAYGSGEDTDQARFDIGLAYNHDAKYRIAGSHKAILYALDAQTGKELWSSGDQIASWSHWGGLSIANGRVYINTFDGMQYCFGIKNGADQTASDQRGSR
ncbi:MAG TPA: PQQ-binding-like beta-propeller repeat protein [Blastocatellia bacterium]|nr:PQQ-binding-like beta-propeller repeat protein [Blastocatellia bacterium]